jgi:cytochrome c553
VPNGTDTHSKDAYHLVWGSLTVIRAIRNFVISFALSGLVTGLRAAQDKQAKNAPPVPTSGAQLYKQNCAVCHGNDGKGNGPPPASSPFAGSPPDLTTLAQRHDGEFPEAYMSDVLRNGVKMRDHGPAEMPVWGTLFTSMSKSDETQVKLRITNLTKYLKSIQRK